MLGVQQIAISGTDKERLKHLWIDLLGLDLVKEYRSKADNVDEDVAAAGVGPFRVEVDLMQPLDPEARPRVDRPPLNHVGLWIDDLPAAVEWLGSKGVRFTPGGVRPGASGHDITFVHPKGSSELPFGGEGVLIELVQAPSEVVDACRELAGDA